MSTKKFSDLPATCSCTLGSSPVMVLCARQAGWSGCFSQGLVEPSQGKSWCLTLKLLGPEGTMPPSVPTDGICSIILGGLFWFGHSLAHCPACLQIRHLPHALSLKDSGVCHRVSLEGSQHLGMPCLFPFLPLLGLFFVIKGNGGCLDHLI